MRHIRPLFRGKDVSSMSTDLAKVDALRRTWLLTRGQQDALNAISPRRLNTGIMPLRDSGRPPRLSVLPHRRDNLCSLSQSYCFTTALWCCPAAAKARWSAATTCAPSPTADAFHRA